MVIKEEMKDAPMKNGWKATVQHMIGAAGGLSTWNPRHESAKETNYTLYRKEK